MTTSTTDEVTQSKPRCKDHRKIDRNELYFPWMVFS